MSVEEHSNLSLHQAKMNRTLSIRAKKNNNIGTARHGFSFASLKNTRPEIGKKLHRMIKSANNLISSHKIAAKERIYMAELLSGWGESTQDEGMKDISDKMGVLLSELGEQEELYAQKLEFCRGILKSVRNTEESVQPSRDTKAKIMDDIARLKAKEPESTKLTTLENWLVRAEAENLVAEAQLTNITRKKIKEAYAQEFSATIERAEKQIILARHGHRLLNLLDDSPVVPGYVRNPYVDGYEARQIINDAEDDLKDWQLDLEDGALYVNQGSKYCSSYLGRQEQTGSEFTESDASNGMAKSADQNMAERTKVSDVKVVNDEKITSLPPGVKAGV